MFLMSRMFIVFFIRLIWKNGAELNIEYECKTLPSPNTNKYCLYMKETHQQNFRKPTKSSIQLKKDSCSLLLAPLKFQVIKSEKF